MLSNAASLVLTTLLTSVLGFVFWAVAARMLEGPAVGRAAAGASAMTLVSTVCMLGLGTVLIGTLARRAAGGVALVSAALVVTFGAATAAGLVFALVARRASREMHLLFAAPFTVAAYVVGCGATAASLVFDQAVIGLLQGRLQLRRNALMAGLKLGLLAAVAPMSRDRSGAVLMDCWALATVLSCVLMWPSPATRDLVAHRPDFRALRRLAGESIAHNLTNLALQLPVLLLPVLVVMATDGAHNAAFFAAWMIVTLLMIVPAHLSTVLFAVMAKDDDVARERLRFSLLVSLVLGVPGVIATVTIGPAILGLFGASFARLGTSCLQILALGYFPFAIKMHAVAIARARRRLGRFAAWLLLASVLEVAAALAGARLWGLPGVALGLIACFTVEALVCAPAVVRPARRGSERAGRLGVWRDRFGGAEHAQDG